MAERDAGAKPIIVKRIKKGGHGHHGGVWKIAYADFVTAMMAFFLLMWVLGSTTAGDLAGISAYFQNPLRVAMAGGQGSGDATRLIKGGGENVFRTVGQESKADADTDQRRISDSAVVNEDARKDASQMEKSDAEKQAENQISKQAEKQAEQAAARREQSKLEQLKQEIDRQIGSDPDLAKSRNQIFMDVTAEGLRIQIVDEKNRPMFDSASTNIAPHARKLLRTIGKALADLPNRVRIEGHTDGVKFPGRDDGYTNWELSAERANAARRELVAGGFDARKVSQVVGYADSVPVNPDDPNDPLNRRISITVQAQPVFRPSAAAQRPGAPAPAPAGVGGGRGAANPGAAGAPAAAPAAEAPSATPQLNLPSVPRVPTLQLPGRPQGNQAGNGGGR